MSFAGTDFAPTRVTVRVRVRARASRHAAIAALASRSAPCDRRARARWGRRPRRLRERWRLQRPARLSPGQADAPRRRARLRPHGGRGARGRRLADRSRAPFAPTPSRRGCSPRHPDPKWVAPPGDLAAPPRHRARPRPARGLRLAGRERAALRLPQALRVGALALRLHAERRQLVGRLRRSAAATARDAAVPVVRARRASRPPIIRAAQRWSVSAHAAGRAALRRVELQPVRASARRARRGSRSSCRARPPPSAWATPSTPEARSTRRRT